MSVRHGSKAAAIAVLALVVVLLGLTAQPALAQAATPETPAVTPPATPPMPAADPNNKPLALQMNMRDLWEQHALWSRMMIIGAEGDEQELAAASDKLAQIHTAMGEAFRAYYGDAAADQLASLLRESTQLTREMLTAMEGNDNTAMADARTRWYANGEQIGVVLSTANPQYWPLDTTRQAIKDYQDAILQQATARQQNNWTADVTAFDSARMNAMKLADAMSTGIVQQYPDRFVVQAPDTPMVQPIAAVQSVPTATVEMTDNAFRPREISVVPGTVVTWKNMGSNTHTVMADSKNLTAGGPNSSMTYASQIRAGASYSWTVPASAIAGTRYYYHCGPHGADGDGKSFGRGMTGVVIVR